MNYPDQLRWRSVKQAHFNRGIALLALPILFFYLGAPGWQILLLPLFVLLALVIAIPAAWAMAFAPGKRTKDLLMWMLSTKMMPPVGALIPLYLIFRDLGLLDTRGGIITVLMLLNLPIVIWMLYTYFKEIPGEILEASRMDGASVGKELANSALALDAYRKWALASLLALPYGAGAPGPHAAGVLDVWVELRIGDGPAERIVHEDALRLLGAFQVENVMAASLAARLLGGTTTGIGLAMATAAPLPFRLQLLATRGGVRIYDNGVSTEVESTRSALQALRGRVHWLGGGKSKDGDYRAVADAVAPHIASAHLFGAAAQPLAAALAGRVPVTVADRLPAAYRSALAAAAPGEAVLWSPAFASFDQYPNFRARAQEFHALVQGRAAAAAGG
jgi:hypothetical protein